MSETIKVTFSKSNKTVVWDGSHDNLLELAEEHGVDIPYSCRSGLDEVCRSALIEGEVDHPDAMMPVEDGYCLPCIAVPKSNIILEA